MCAITDIYDVYLYFYSLLTLLLEALIPFCIVKEVALELLEVFLCIFWFILCE